MWPFLRRGVKKQKIYSAIPKIVAPYRSKDNRFSFTEKEAYGSQDVYYITEKDKDINLKYVLALLNSKLYYLWLYYRGKRKGNTLELYQKPLSEVPIINADQEIKGALINLVSQILDIKEKSPEENVTNLERRIDMIVYDLYGLTPEEIKIVEEAVHA